MPRKTWLAILVSLCALNLFAVGVWAQSNPPSSSTVSILSPARAKPDGKMSFRLAMLAQSSSLRAATSEEQARALSLAPQGAGSLLRNTQGQILVDIRLTDLSAGQLQALRDAGAQIVHVADRYQIVTAFVDATKLVTVANLATVQSIQEELTPIVGDGSPIVLQQNATRSVPNACPTGNAVSEGDTQLKAALARSTYSVDGAGVKVGILSDSYDQNAGAVTHASNDVASGDLPGTTNPCGFTTSVNVLANANSGSGSDEGRAMLQIVHDLAPGAQLSFASAFNGLFTFADNIRALRTAGADIIADDVFYYAEPFFQEGPVNVAISDVVSSGAVYFTLAGNNNKIISGNNVASYEAPIYRPTACPSGLGFTGDCHNFDPSGGVNNGSGVTLSNGGVLQLDLQWNEPWYGIATDLDVYLLDDSNVIRAWSANTNSTTQMPFEFFQFQNTTGSTQHYRIVINRSAGTGTPRLKYQFIQNTSGLTNVQYNTSSGGDIVGPTLYGHSSTRYGLSTAAVPYNDSTTPETYTSRGPAVHYFGPVVNTTPAGVISPDTIQQPNFAATDGGCTTFFGGFSNGCYRFYGTSAATPHAAAVGALLKQRATVLHVPFNRGIVQLVLQSTAQPVSGGNVNSVGAGLIDALGATGQLANLKSIYLPFISR